MAQIVLHIGDHKTGSTSIQKAMAQLVDNTGGVQYCVSGRGNRIAHHNLVWAIKNKGRHKAELGGWKKLGKEISASSADKCVVSSEAFEFVSPAKVLNKSSSILDGNVFRIIVYVRPHFSRMLSGYLQQAKTGQIRESLDDFVKRRSEKKSFMMAQRLARWCEVFGRENIIVRPFIRSLLEKNDVLSDFSVHGLQKDADFLTSAVDTKSVNVSPSMDVVRVIYKCAEYLGTDKNKELARVCEEYVYSPLRSRLADIYPVESGGKPRFSSETIDYIKDFYLEDAVALDQQYFPGSTVFQDSLMNYKAPEGLDDASLITEREQTLHDIYSEMLANLVKETDWYKKNQL